MTDFEVRWSRMLALDELLRKPVGRLYHIPYTVVRLGLSHIELLDGTVFVPEDECAPAAVRCAATGVREQRVALRDAADVFAELRTILDMTEAENFGLCHIRLPHTSFLASLQGDLYIKKNDHYRAVSRNEMLRVARALMGE